MTKIDPNLTRIYPKINCLDFCPKAGRDFLCFPKFHQKTWSSPQKCNLWSQNRDFINFITGLSQFNSNLFSFTWRNTLNLSDFIRTLSKDIYPIYFLENFSLSFPRFFYTYPPNGWNWVDGLWFYWWLYLIIRDPRSGICGWLPIHCIILHLVWSKMGWTTQGYCMILYSVLVVVEFARCGQPGSCFLPVVELRFSARRGFLELMDTMPQAVGQSDIFRHRDIAGDGSKPIVTHYFLGKNHPLTSYKLGTYGYLGYQGFCMFRPINSSWKFRNQSKKICRKLSWDVLCLVRLWRWILYRTSSRFSRRCWWELQVPTCANHLGYLGRMNISPSYAIAMYWWKPGHSMT